MITLTAKIDLLSGDNKTLSLSSSNATANNISSPLGAVLGLKKEGKNYVWRSGSEKVTIRGNVWYHQYERVGGEAVDFVKKFYNKTYTSLQKNRIWRDVLLTFYIG